MSWSAAEIMTLASKAARGAGAPPAQADRFGQVAALHLMAHRAADELTIALDALPDGPILIYPLAIDRALSEAAKGLQGVIRDIPNCGLIASYAEALPFQTLLVGAQGNVLRLNVDLTQPRKSVVPRRISNCDSLVAQMYELAARTFVPESETSRLSGAGAGLTDND